MPNESRPDPCDYFPVPKTALDPFFHRGRNWWYLQAKRGHITIRTEKAPGAKRGQRPCIKFSEAREMMAKFWGIEWRKDDPAKLREVEKIMEELRR